MDVDDNDIVEIKENTAITRTKVESIESKIDRIDQQINRENGLEDRVEKNRREIGRMKTVGSLMAGLASTMAAAGGWILNIFP